MGMFFSQLLRLAILILLFSQHSCGRIKRKPPPTPISNPNIRPSPPYRFPPPPPPPFINGGNCPPPPSPNLSRPPPTPLTSAGKRPPPPLSPNLSRPPFAWQPPPPISGGKRPSPPSPSRPAPRKRHHQHHWLSPPVGPYP